MAKDSKLRRVLRSVAATGMSAILVFSLGPGAAIPAFASEVQADDRNLSTDTGLAQSASTSRGSAGTGQAPDARELVTIIVQLEGDGASAASTGGFRLFAQEDTHATLKAEIAELAQAYSGTSESEGGRGGLRLQAESGSGIQEVADYVNVIDGFAVKAPAGILGDVKELDGVKRAFIERVFEVGSDEGGEGEAASSVLGVSGSGEAETVSASGLVAVGGADLGGSDSAEPKNQSTLDMTGASSITQKGDGQVIAILDSGFDTSHDVFSGEMDESKVSWSREIAQQRRSACAQGGRNALYVSPKIPFAYDYGDGDSNVVPSNAGLDHGAHVAGIAAANGGEIRGSAPNAQLALMKVANDFTGSIYESSLIAALDDVAALEPDVVSMSLGSDGGFSAEDSDTMNDIFAKLESNGANICISAGNSYTSAKGNRTGEDLAYASDPDTGIVSSPASSPLATAVASLENARDLPYFTAANGSKICYVDAERSEGCSFLTFDSLDDGVYEYVDAGYGTQEECQALKEKYGSLRGKIAITEDRQIATGSGIVMSGNRASNLDSLRPAAIILYNSGKGAIEAVGVGAVNRPVICISNEDGRALVSALDKRMTVKDGLVAAPTANYSVDGFSSWGTTPEMMLKPEVAAPGGSIYSSVLNNKYGVKSGTSMAAPHFAGLCALVREYVNGDPRFSRLSAAEQRDVVTQLLMSTARPLRNLSAENGYYSPRQQGAGSVDVSRAVATSVYLTVDGAASESRPKAELGESSQGTWSFTVELHNVGDAAQSYRPDTVALVESIDAGKFQQDSSDYAGKGVTVTYGGPAYDDASGLVSVAAGSTAAYTVTLSCDDSLKAQMSEAVNGTFIDGFALLEAASVDGVDLSVPYLGFYGDWSAAPVFDASEGSGEEPRRYAARIVSAATEKQLGVNPLSDSSEADQAKAVVSAVDAATAPNTLEPRVSLLRGARTLAYSYADASGKVVRSYTYDYVAKSTKDDVYANLKPKPLFTGTDDDGAPVPDGNYTLTVSAVTAGPGSETQTCAFSFVKDTKAPEIESVEVQGAGDEATVQVVVRDAGFLAGIDFVNPASGDSYLRVLDDRASVVENADGSRSYTVSIARSEVEQAWAAAGNDSADFPATPLVSACDYGMNRALSDGTNAGDGLVVNEETGELTGYTGSATVVAVPDGVTSIAANAFKGSTVKAVSLPASVRSIGAGAFSDTASLVQVAFEDSDENPSQLTSIGERAFSGSAVRNLSLPRSVTSLGNSAFAKSSLDSIQLPDSLVTVPALAFSESSVRVVYLPASVRDIGASAFESCRDLAWVGFKRDGAECEGFPGSVRTVGEDAFRKSGIRSLVLNEGLTSIAGEAFAESSLDELSIPDSVTDLQKRALGDIKHMTKLALGAGVTPAQVQNALSGCESLQEIQVSAASTNLGSQDGVLFTADASSLVAYPTGRGGGYVVPAGVTEVCPFAFRDASVSSVSLGTVELVGEGAFSGSALTSVSLGSVKEIRENAFANCSALTDVDFRADAALASIGKMAFSPGTPLERVELPDSVAEVGARAFANNSSLIKVRLGASFAGDYNSVFEGCGNVESLQVAPDNAFYDSDESVLYRKKSDGLYLQRSLPAGQLESYTVKSGTVTIGSYAFAGNDRLTSVVLPEGVKTVETAAFSGCANLAHVTFPNSLETVTGFANTAIQTAEFGTGIRNIKSTTFSGHNPAQLIVRGGQDGAYASSLEEGDDPQPIKSAYFGPGMKSANFAASAIAPPVVTVVPASLTSLKFNAPSASLNYDANAVLVYAQKDTAGWKAAKAALESIGANVSKQLVEYRPLSVSASHVQDAAKQTVNINLKADGGVLTSVPSESEEVALGEQPAYSFRFVSVAENGAESVLADWSSSPAYSGAYELGSSIRCEARDSFGATAATAIAFEKPQSGDDPARTDDEAVVPTIASAKVSGSYVYTGKAIKPVVTVTAKDGTKVSATNYVVTYSRNVNAGTARVLVVGRGAYAGAATATFAITPAPIAKAKVALKAASRPYTGKVQRGAVKSVVLAGRTLTAGADYTVRASSGKKAGSYQVTVIGTGNYKGAATATFKVEKIAPKLKTAGVKSFKAKKLRSKAASFRALKLTTDGKVSWKVVKRDPRKVLSLKAGKVTVKKGAKVGSYSMKVRVSAKAGANYKALKAKAYTIKVKVKK